ncbi:MAG: type II toxin-antitoxin system HicA family toxin [Caldilineaceae bacterium]|nr:type II toxin-antitoxin system HicA family toxin [Caldilineaceae bacterium]
MSSREVIAKLKEDGWDLVRVRGSHHQYKHPIKPGRVTVPHPQKDLPLGTLRNIFRQAGWEWKSE